MNINKDSHREARAELYAAREPTNISAQLKESITLRELQYYYQA